MKILIAGGTGLLGSRLVSRLSADGHEIRVLTRSAPVAHPSGVEFLQWDGKRLDPDAVGPTDAIINLAGAGIADHKWTAAYKQRILDSRVHATRALVTYIHAQSQKPQVLLQASAAGYYGTHPGKVFTEADGPGKDFLAKTCILWEAAAQDAGIRTVWVRTGLVLAPEGGAFPKLLQPFKFYAGGHLGDGRQPFPWIHADDVTGIIHFALTHPQVEGPLNAAAPEQMTNRDFARLLGRLLGKPSGLPVPAFAIRTLLGEQATLVLEGQRISCQKLLDLGYSFQYPRAEAAVIQLLNPTAG
ncbi:MAG: TIGR01777 family oxidoreductase [Bacteroidetes bacterium]|nr:TIGR01777 family oxidoreductase [Bacteroidota bacterium]